MKIEDNDPNCYKEKLTQYLTTTFYWIFSAEMKEKKHHTWINSRIEQMMREKINFVQK